MPIPEHGGHTGNAASAEQVNHLIAKLRATGDAAADDLARILALATRHDAGHTGDDPYKFLLVFEPLLGHAVFAARTLLDIIEHPPMGSPPETLEAVLDLKLLHLPAASRADLDGAVAALLRRGMPGDESLAELMAWAAARAVAPFGQGSETADWMELALAAARELQGAGAAARFVPGPRGGENVL